MEALDPRGRTRVVVALGFVVGVGALAHSCHQAPPLRDEADARIAFYEARLGGRATYPAYTGLGLAYFQKARETGVARYLDAAKRYLLESQQRQSNIEALKGLAAVQLARHEFREAFVAAEEAVRAHPSDPGAIGALFDAHLALGEDEDAARVLDTLQRVSPGFLTDARLSNLEEYRGRTAEAIAAMQRACTDAERIRAAPATRAWCRVRLGVLLVTACQADRGEGLYREALQLFRNYYLAREELAELAAARGRIAEAIALYEGLLRTNPSPSLALAQVRLFEAARQVDHAAVLRAEAVSTLRDSAASGHRTDWRPLALLLLEDDATVGEGLGWARRDWDNRHDAFAADTLAWALYRGGRPREAASLITRALERGTRVPTILLHGAEIALGTGRPSDADALLQRLPPCKEALEPREQAWTARLQSAAQRPWRR